MSAPSTPVPPTAASTPTPRTPMARTPVPRTPKTPLPQFAQSSDSNIRVVCRFRPQTRQELNDNGVPIVAISDKTTVNLIGECPGMFSFDRVFDCTETQHDVFEYSASSIVDDVMNGYNGTIFAYGQTGSGKTYTMMGNMDDDNLKGITPRIIEAIFSRIHGSPNTLEFTVKVSYMEIYMENIRDLLNPSNDNLPVHEDKVHGVYVKGLTEPFVSSVGEVFEAMYRGQKWRAVGYTNMNAESSRSHSIFVVQVTQRDVDTGSVKVGKLSLVDLAGSEKVGKTGATGQTLEEAKKINKSLSALGMVIHALTDAKSTHVPYRDSKLTRILQESIGGNSRTMLIINCSPSSVNEGETVSTLRFGVRAKTVKNKAKVNAEMSAVEMKEMLKKIKKEVALLEGKVQKLESEVGRWRRGEKVPEEEWVKSGIVAVAPAAEPVFGNRLDLVDRLRDVEAEIVQDVGMSEEEREEFLRRENEMSDLIVMKEREVELQKKKMEMMTEEVERMKIREEDLVNELEEMRERLKELEMDREKVAQADAEKVIETDQKEKVESDQEKMAEKGESSIMKEGKLYVLERNLSQLMVVQRELVDQNGKLKRELSNALRKIEMKEERILNLEGMLMDAERRSERESEFSGGKIAKVIVGGREKKRASWYISLLRK